MFQFAYKQSTGTALLKVQILNSVDKQENVILLRLYLSVAFDTIAHNILLAAATQ